MKTFQTFDISAEYDAIHRTFPCHKDAPVIGLTGNFQEGACTLLEGYFTSILKAGGIPFIIPPVDETNSLINSLNALDGLLLTGGADINPLFLGEEPIKELHSINPGGIVRSYCLPNWPPTGRYRFWEYAAAYR